MRKRLSFTEEQLKEIQTLYSNGLSFNAISKHFNVSQTGIQNLFAREGWETKGHGRRRYSLDETYFDVIDTPNKAYILGLLFADGCNYPDTGEVRLSLQESEYSFLEDIKRELKSNRPIKCRHFDKESWKDSYTLSLCSKHMSLRLEELGMIHNKSLTLEFPSWITEDYFPFMLKGYIDGNGWVQQYRIGFMSSNKFAYGVQSFLKEHYDIDSTVMDMKRHYDERTKTWYVCNKKNYLPLTEMMFSKPTLCIERKYKKYLEYGFLKK